MAGIFAGLLAIIALVVIAFLFIKTKKAKNKNANGGVAFENPSYLRETNVEQVHVNEI
jgi:TRAP-type C4-dicarboxylate transport system permease large subunit